MNPLIIRLIEIAKEQVGIHEVGGNNQGPQIREFQKATTLNPGPWPWCAAFVCWCIREWLVNTPTVLEYLKVPDTETIYWRPKTAGAFGLVDWGKKEHL